MIWIVAGLVLAWGALWLRSRMRARRAPGVDAKQLLVAHDLENEAATADRDGRFFDAQRLRLQATWLRIKPGAGRAVPPNVLDSEDASHLMLADVVRRRYADALATTDHDYVSCTVRPSSLLPFPRDYISSALELFVDLARGVRTSPHVTSGSISDQELEIVERSRQMLTSFVDWPPDKVPTDPEANLRFAQEHVDQS